MEVFELHRNYDHLVDMSYDISLIPFEGSKSLRNNLRRPKALDFNVPIEFIGNILVLKDETDFPIVSPSMPVMSQFMIDVFGSIKSSKSLNIRIYSTIIIDDTYMGNLRDDNGCLKRDVEALDHFPLVHVMDKLKLFDYKNSVYNEMNEWEIFPALVSKFIVKEPKEGFPPLFRIFEKPSSLFVSTSAKEALEHNNIKGCIFEEVDVTPYVEDQET